MTPQVQTLLTHLQNHGSISQAEAGTVYKIRALPRRIADLKAEGYEISRELKTDPTGQRYARYYYVGKKPKVGDKVRITNEGKEAHGAFGTYYKVGDTGTIKHVSKDGSIDIAMDTPRLLNTPRVSAGDYEVIPNGN